MLQDIAFGRLENEFKVLAPETNDRVVCIRSGEILLNPDGSLPLLAPMSEVAGRLSVQIGAHLLESHAKA